MLKEYHNSKKQGDAGLGVAIGWFAVNSDTVCIPLTDSQDYDLIVDRGEGLKRVQVRTTRCKNKYGRFVVNLVVGGGNRTGTGKVKCFDPARVEFLFVVTQEGKKYLIASQDVRVKKQLVLGEGYEKFVVE